MPPTVTTTSRPPARASQNTPDLIATVILLAVLVSLAVVASFFGMWIGMATDSCDDTCNYDVIGTGAAVGVFLPWVGVLVAVPVAALRLRRHRISWWVPLIASVTLLSPFIGSAIASTGV